jgi:endonuclease I
MKKRYFIISFLLICSLGFAQIPNNYYDNATGSGYTLKNQLKTIIDNIDDGNGQNFHDTSVTYGDLWEVYKTSDVRSDGKVWDIYSDCNFTFVTNQDNGTGGGAECDKYNREHTFAQSWYGGNNSHPLRSDAFHVLPTDKKVNNIRGNLAFGEVLTANYTSSNGSKRGASSISGPNDIVFEPINEYKGDIARGLFYVSVRYQNEISSWENNNNGADNMLDGSGDRVFEQWALDMLYRWHTEDPVSQKEIDRNEVIFNHQKNRNPFIDHPEYISSIWSSVLSIDNSFSFNTIKLFPNPSNGNTITVSSMENLQLTFFDILGKKVLQSTSTTTNKTVDVSKLRTGIYFVKLENETGSTTKKFIKK